MTIDIKGCAESFLLVREILQKRVNDEEAPEEERDQAFAMIRSCEDDLISAWVTAVNAKPAPVAASNGQIVSLPGLPGEASDWYSRFVQLGTKYGRNAPDLIRRWFSDIEGGWDKATDQQKQEIFDKAQDYYAGRDPNAEHDHTRCYACGSPGDLKKTRNGDEFYVCSNQDCGYENQYGDFKNSSWDADGSNWEEKRDRFRNAGRGRSRGRSTSGSGGSRGRGGYRR